MCPLHLASGANSVCVSARVLCVQRQHIFYKEHLSITHSYCLRSAGTDRGRTIPLPHTLALPTSFNPPEVQMARPTSSDTCWGVHYAALMEGGHRVTKQSVKVLWHHIRHVLGARWLSFWTTEQLITSISHFTFITRAHFHVFLHRQL